MQNAIIYWLDLLVTIWNTFKSNPIASIGLVSLFFTFVIKYLDHIKQIFK